MWRFDPEMQTGTWKTVSSPVSVTLHDAVHSANGPVAVGKGGRVVARASDGTWGVIVENGPSARGETLYCADVTDDGKRVWFAGANGALGYYDLPEHARTDCSAPRGVGNAFHGVAVSGARGTEKVLVADGSGNALPGEVTDGEPTWDDPTSASGGAALSALSADGDGIGYAVDSNSNAWRTTASGWQRIGVADAQNSFYAVTATADVVVVGGGNGRVYEWERPAETDAGGTDPVAWTPFTLGSFTVQGLDGDGTELLAGGGSGNLYYRKGERDWTPVGWSGSKSLRGVAVGDPNLAVGKSGTIVEQVSEPDSSN
jgi:hypothetical protein